VPGATPLEIRMDDIRAVLDAVDSQSAAIMGESEGGALSILFAAAHPERVRALILQGAEVCERNSDTWAWGDGTDEQKAAYIERIPEGWGNGAKIRGLAPWLVDDPRLPALEQWWGKLQRNSATPVAWQAFARMAFEIDLRQVVPTIHVPTLILHAT